MNVKLQGEKHSLLLIWSLLLALSRKSSNLDIFQGI